MQIQIRYQHRDRPSSEVINLSPDEYFDPIDEGEFLSVRSMARFQEGYRYTPFRPNELKWIILEITDGAEFWKIRTQYLDGERSLMHHSQSSDGSEEIIHQIWFSIERYQTIRTQKEPGKQWTVVMNHLGVEAPNGLASEQDYLGRWSWDELLAFGDVS